MKSLCVMCAILVLGLLFSCAGPKADLAVISGNVIDCTGSGVQHNVVVIINGSKIVRIVPKGEFDPRSARKVIDASDKFLMPGLFDMHGHVTMGKRWVSDPSRMPGMSAAYRKDVSEWILRTLLSYGVTTIRSAADEMAGEMELKEELLAGSLQGPRLFTCGPLIEGTPPIFTPGISTIVTSDEEARAEVDRQVKAGVDFIKVYASLSPELMKTVVDASHRHGKKVLAHLRTTTWKQAAEMGVDNIVHCHPMPGDILTEEQLATIRDLPPIRQMQSAYSMCDPASKPVQELFRIMKEKNIANDPTIVVFRNYVMPLDSIEAMQGEEMKHVPPFMLEGWKQELSLRGPKSPEEYDRFRQSNLNVMRFVKAEFDAGLRLLVGSDYPNPNTIPGLSLHQELQLLVESGIPEMTVLKMATHNAAEWLGIAGEVGTVEPDKQADLLILNGNPLEDIRHTRNIFMVIQRGRVIDRILP